MIVPMQSFDTKLLAEGVTAALLEAGYTIVKVGAVPWWMKELTGQPGCYYVDYVHDREP